MQKRKKQQAAKQKKASKRQHTSRQSGGFATPQSQSVNDLPAHATSQSLRQAQLAQMQRHAGNGFVNRKLGEETAVIQRYRDPVRPVPGMSNIAVVQAEDAIAAGTRQKAIDIVLAELAAQGRINTAELDGGTMRYTSSMSDEGHTISYWSKDPAKYPDAKLLPFEVKIGPSAFASVPWLYATVIHEWRHVQQFRVPKAMADRNAATEVDAYLNGIEQAWESGLTTEEVKELWTRLHDDHWITITDPGVKANLQPRVNAAKAYVDSLTFSGPVSRIYHNLSFVQLFFATGSAELDATANAELAYLVSEVQAHLSTNYDDDLRFRITGFASPRWRHPARGAMPEDLNHALSKNRADNTLEQIRNIFQADLAGSCDFTIQTCVGDEVMVDDITWDSLAHGAGATPALAEGRALNSDDQQDRRVEVKVDYSPSPMRATRPPAWLGGGGKGI